MCLRTFFIISFALIGVINSMNVILLSRCIMSEAPDGNEIEQTVMGFACQRNPKHSPAEAASPVVYQLAKNISKGTVNDSSNGANHWYSPSKMPKENETNMCTQPVGRGPLDCNGGLEYVCGTMRNYIPSWALLSRQVNIEGVRDCNYKFFVVNSGPYDSMNSLLYKRLKF